jgi:2-polyprenyl-3-methyl-5-hydroxy-6-metoxy-1,4-benzoquinol methylase
MAISSTIWTHQTNQMPLSQEYTALCDFVADRILVEFAVAGAPALDLGAGAGRMTEKLESFGCDVVAVGRTSKGYAAASRLIVVDLDESDFAGKIEPGAFQLVTALEILDRVENPIGFLTNIRKLLAPDGVAVLTVTKLDLLPTPVKFVLDHVIESDQHRGAEIQSPVFLELFCKNFLAFAGMALRDHQVFPQESLRPRASLPWLVHHILVIEPLNNATSVPTYPGPNHQ